MIRSYEGQINQLEFAQKLQNLSQKLANSHQLQPTRDQENLIEQTPEADNKNKTTTYLNKAQAEVDRKAATQGNFQYGDNNGNQQLTSAENLQENKVPFKVANFMQSETNLDSASNLNMGESEKPIRKLTQQSDKVVDKDSKNKNGNIKQQPKIRSQQNPQLILNSTTKEQELQHQGQLIMQNEFNPSLSLIHI
eukprot:TRINITY_DN14213_c0_g1_i2.p2 TRINITY_DN14213_c0_g1~~TRINITY_DN14213_c0_g1_i2.p2  ORF type:complete len:194 (+),score=31.60 TRINITY_DN14213_c0_g1_i2:311-892(+)